MAIGPSRGACWRPFVLAVVLALAAALLGALPPTAQADPHPTIASVEKQVAALEVDVENAAEAADEAQARLADVRHRLSMLTDRLATEKVAYGHISDGLGSLASAVYRGGGLDIDVQVLLATDPNDLLNRLAAVDHVAATQDALLRRTAAARLTLADTEAAVAEQEASATALEQAARTHQQEAAQALAKAKALLSTLRAEERRRLAEAARKARLAQIARAKAAAEAVRREQARAAAAAAREKAARDKAARDSSGGGGSSGGGSSGGGSSGGGSSGGGSSGGDTGGGSTPAPTGSGRASDAVAAALSRVGHAYVAGGRGPDVFDCSGLTAWAWAQAGVSLTAYSFAQWDETSRVSRDQLRPGDLVFFFGLGAHHVAMYIGGGEMVQAANPSRGVIISSVDESWYAARLSGFGRVHG